VKILGNDDSGGDSQRGNLVARSMRLQGGVEAELALTNSLGIRADFERGKLTIEQMCNVSPFENTITVMYLAAAQRAGQDVQGEKVGCSATRSSIASGCGSTGATATSPSSCIRSQGSRRTKSSWRGTRSRPNTSRRSAPTIIGATG
jgi:hypothetical protein